MSVSNGDFVDTYDDGMPGLIEGSAINEEIERQEEQETKRRNSIPAPDGENEENRRVVNYLYMGKGLWDWAKNTANKRGMKLERFIVTLMEDARRSWTEPNDTDSPETYVLWARERASVISEVYEDAFAIAVSCKNYPTDENIQLLYSSCEKLGLDPGELMERVREDKWADLVVKYRRDPDSKMSRCVEWIINFCRDRDEILSEDFNKAGSEAGYTRQMLSAARRKVGIESVLKGGKYYLSMPVGRKVLHGKVGK